ncbi:MAG: retron system putative HNH endonuclease [Clostridiaceae bacterium]
MLKVNKEQEPEFLLQFKRINSPRTWDDYNCGTIKRQLKEYIVKMEQNNYCPYCETAIYESDDCHIEHIKPRDYFPQLFEDYNNLIASCNGKNTCGNSKENGYGDNFINPVIENPKDYFTFNIFTGEIIPSCKSQEDIRYKKAEFTIKLLNLNCTILVEARKNLITILEVYKENYDDYSQYLEYFLRDGHSFPSLINYYIEELM